MKKKKKNLIMQVAILGGICVFLILLVGTIWMGQSANRDTKEAVRNVSLMYLDELAERREQVVASTLNDYISDMDIALGLMEKDDLDSTDNLRAFQARMKRLYGLEKFAFFDTNGLIYTSRGTRTDIDRYKFDYINLTEPEISIKQLSGKTKKVIIAMPVDNLPFQGKNLVVCFIEIDMNKLLENISMLTDTNNNTTFCNLYTTRGIPLTNRVLGGLASEDTLFPALQNADFEKGSDLETMQENFKESKEGVVSFSYNGIQETLYYVPVQGTDWMLTYLIRESVLNEQIRSISEGIISRSLIQSILSALVLVGMFVFMILQIRKNSKMTLEKELSEAENRIKQQELEEQIAMQEELLEQEKKRAEQDEMITALASDYRTVYYVDIETDHGICYRKDPAVNDGTVEGDDFYFQERFTYYAEKYVDEKYKEGFLKFIEPDEIKKALEKSVIISYRYLIHRDGRESYEMLRMAGVRHP